MTPCKRGRITVELGRSNSYGMGNKKARCADFAFSIEERKKQDEGGAEVEKQKT
jgi:hypothetical protein